ncbi:HAMP domain-containing histidine kinase [Catenulispora sp. NF23]|uniref:Signal transduction histidine-protein kinase/phosphatase MprB n=1 Tax=Catenulispora pinistramenti TaxID=2705254 RepID=A0ABS5L6F8_9ACTN|nr:HAMP domain-containing sensor histidine kinase [Catenulispora pinistramenti]MBS2538547.1 HAMP domain-containing histidine kinase [Catenulispora pinistramenti]MBS2553897.1 HAMP domain-containing histidine kinase [Catenulispora pinistramenti]
MRRRLVSSTFLVVMMVVILLGVPLAVLEVRSVDTSTKTVLSTEARTLAETVSMQVSKASLNGASTGPLGDYVPNWQRMIALNHAAVIAVDGQSPIAVNTLPAGTSTFTATYSVDRVLANVGVHVTVQATRAPADQQIRRTMYLIGGVALAVLVAATGLAYLQARRLTKPLEELAATAERLGSGDPRPRHRRYGISELDRVAEVIDSSADRISTMLGAERRLAAEASHELRTPLAALSMRLEEIITLADDPQTVRDEAEVALSQVERLTDVVQRLLTTARTHRRSDLAVPIEVDTVIRQQVHEWRPAYQSMRRGIVVSGERRLMAMATPGAFSQILSTLLENSLIHGAGTVTVHTRAVGGSVVVEVGDEGDGIAPDLEAKLFQRGASSRGSTGLGLAVARELAEADGGRLNLVLQRPAVFAVFLTEHSPLSVIAR